MNSTICVKFNLRQIRETREGKMDNEYGQATVSVTVQPRAERRLLRPTGGRQHVDFVVRVQEQPGGRQVGADRTALNLALVLDRSGSMSGSKLATAKLAAQAVLDRLDERDQVAVVVFDDRIDVLQAAAPATSDTKGRIARALAEVEARANTALHEGWLTGCRTIAGDVLPPNERRVARCFLLTDGLANVGLTDPEKIAGEAAGIREKAGIGTSTFGIGEDYAEGLLGPMAVAGGGQFHHLRVAEEIARTFVGELGELLAVAAGQVHLELALDPGVTADVISEYWVAEQMPQQLAAPSIAVGDLLRGEERHIVVRFAFPPVSGQGRTVRARAVWASGGQARATEWQPLEFGYADHATCDAEGRDLAVMHWVGLHHAARAKRRAADLNRRGQYEEARSLLHRVAAKINEYARNDSDLLAAVRELEETERVASAPMPPMAQKEMYYLAQTASRSQRDLRQKK
jgi:Ca-activated chloride channel homolog